MLTAGEKALMKIVGDSSKQRSDPLEGLRIKKSIQKQASKIKENQKRKDIGATSAHCLRKVSLHYSPNPRSFCDACGEEFKVYECGKCGRLIWESCRECHAEKIHNIITPQFIRPQFGGSSGKNNDDPWQQNAVRALEDEHA